MFVSKHPTPSRRWWSHGSRPRPVRKQWRRLAAGCIFGALLYATFHFLTRDSKFVPILHRKWLGLWSSNNSFDGVGAYKVELAVLCTAIAAIALPPALLWCRRFARSWWAGIASVLALIAAIVTFSALEYGLICPKLTGAIGLSSVVAAFVVERWRNQARLYPVSRPNIPTKKASSAEPRWETAATDDPITDWGEDIIGRTAVVELLADYALRLRTPVVALHGGFGDGKSSVLNLLRSAVEGQAIVVSFNAWLPGSETTFATDLFKDIATECRKFVNVPQLRKRALAFARTIGGSVGYLAGLKELVPDQSQRDEVEELRDALCRVPKPILVLLDEIDRMQKDEILVLLKILRGASSIPNVTFVCALNEEEVTKTTGLSPQYLEKFFPVSINLSPPAPEMIGRFLRAQLQQQLNEQRWFRTEKDSGEFGRLFEQLWADSLQNACANLRKARLLLNDVLAAGGPIAGEVSPLDLVMIEAIRRFAPRVYRMVRDNAEHLTDAQKNLYFKEDKDAHTFFANLNREVDSAPESAAVRVLLYWLFPKYASASGSTASILSGARRSTADRATEDEKRICVASYFQIYFRAAVPEEMFSNAELDQLLSVLNEAKTSDAVESAFNATLNSIPPKSSKRGDFLWRLARGSERLSIGAAEQLAYAVASRAEDFRYDAMNLGEGAYAQNIVFVAAQKLSATQAVQRVLEGAMARASDDTFAVRLLSGTENPSRNKILTDLTYVDVPGVKLEFVRRMRKRYAQDSGGRIASLIQADWWAFRVWAQSSEEDRNMEQDFWRRFIGTSRKKLAQAANFIYPGNVFWEQHPRPTVDEFFPLNEFDRLIAELPDEQLDEIERQGLARMQDLLQGNYRASP
jgi:hypothetical protein